MNKADRNVRNAPTARQARFEPDVVRVWRDPAKSALLGTKGYLASSVRYALQASSKLAEPNAIHAQRVVFQKQGPQVAPTVTSVSIKVNMAKTRAMSAADGCTPTVLTLIIMSTKLDTRCALNTPSATAQSGKQTQQLKYQIVCVKRLKSVSQESTKVFPQVLQMTASAIPVFQVTCAMEAKHKNHAQLTFTRTRRGNPNAKAAPRARSGKFAQIVEIQARARVSHVHKDIKRSPNWNASSVLLVRLSTAEVLAVHAQQGVSPTLARRAVKAVVSVCIKTQHSNHRATRVQAGHTPQGHPCCSTEVQGMRSVPPTTSAMAPSTKRRHQPSRQIASALPHACANLGSMKLLRRARRPTASAPFVPRVLCATEALCRRNALRTTTSTKTSRSSPSARRATRARLDQSVWVVAPTAKDLVIHVPPVM
jgi:hypothetical protein